MSSMIDLEKRHRERSIPVGFFMTFKEGEFLFQHGKSGIVFLLPDKEESAVGH